MAADVGTQVDRAARRALEVVSLPVARASVWLGVSPDVLTALGFVGNVVVAALIIQGRLAIAGVVMILAGLFDALDGAAARLAERAGKSGALLDSVIDRYSESAVYMGLLIYFFRANHLLGVALAFLAIIGSLLVSYIRARAEGLNIQCRVGLMQRGERIVLLAVGLIWGTWWPFEWASSSLGSAPFLVFCLGVLALLAHITALHRLIFSYNALQRAARS